MHHAVEALRRGMPVRVLFGASAVTIMACETAHFPSRPADCRILAITGSRAAALGLSHSGRDIIRIGFRHPPDARMIAYLTDPCAESVPELDAAQLDILPAPDTDRICIALVKSAGLLPAVEVMTPDREIDGHAAEIDAVEITPFHDGAPLLMRSSRFMTIPGAGDACVIVFRARSGGGENLAILIGQIDTSQAILTRLHSECLTGDLLGSLRCDCGEQLRGAISEITRAGGGVLLYLAQEGRGIGLINKLRAYRLQDRGFDTIDANLHLGFEGDERSYASAAQILGLLGIRRIRLMTNNPEKIEAVRGFGIDVVDQVPHIFPSNGHNRGYLRTKAVRSGHLF